MSVQLGEHSEPQPDITLAQPRTYAAAHPGPEDVFLIVEVADASEDYDRRIKVPLYAWAGIPEVWIVGQSLSPVAFPDLSLAVDEILG